MVCNRMNHILYKYTTDPSARSLKVYSTNNDKMTVDLTLAVILFIICTCMLQRVWKHIRRVIHTSKIMKNIKFKNDEKVQLLNTNCTICLDDFDIDEKLIVLSDCKHVFHKECINTWLCMKQTCPNCQHAVV